MPHLIKYQNKKSIYSNEGKVTKKLGFGVCCDSVSYTHLTLPTNSRV